MNFFDFTPHELKESLKNWGLKPFAAKQVYDWVYRKGEYNPENWSNISKEARLELKKSLVFDLPVIVWEGKSIDGTRKFLLKMSDGNTIESVLIPAKERRTLCLSSQVGCAIGCKFCHTGTQGLTRHLKTHEIVGQYMVVNQWLKDRDLLTITNMVYMGQGEPLHNYNNIKKATEIFLEPLGLGIGQRRITLSTSGLVPQIEKLIEFPPVNIAISLHSARDDIRSELMPINKVYDLKRLFGAIKKIPLKAYRRITYEYILIKDLNDTEEDVLALANLLKRKESKINIIPFNEYPGSPYKRPSDKKIELFQKALLDRDFVCTIRASKGDDILAACGQLKSEYEKLNLWDDDKKQSLLKEKEQAIFR